MKKGTKITTSEPNFGEEVSWKNQLRNYFVNDRMSHLISWGWQYHITTVNVHLSSKDTGNDVKDTFI